MKDAVDATRRAKGTDNAAAQRYSAPALEKGLDILEVLTESSTGYTLNELAQRLDRSVGEIFRMAVTLQRRGYVQMGDGDRYTLTLKLFELGNRQAPIQSLTALAQPLLRDLASQALQSCHLSVYEGGRIVIIAQADSPERWSFGLKVGAVMGLTDTSSGHVILAFRDDEERARMLEAHSRVDGELDIDFPQLVGALEEIRKRGYERVASRQTRGITNIAFPVIGSSGYAVGAINVPFIERIDRKVAPDQNAVRDLVGKAAAELSRLLGYAGGVPRKT
jgi:DNA-binding IclR family transcriptional regulator